MRTDHKMLFQGEVSIRAPRHKVWAFLTDPRAVGSCAPDVESLDILEGGRKFRAVAAVGFGAMKARFVTDAEWVDLEEPNRARMRAHGKAPGSAVDVTSEMRLSDGENGATQLQWTADVNVVGTIASIAARLMGGAAQRLTDAFFDAVRQRIEGGVATTETFSFGPVPLDEATGAVLGHNIAAANGRRLLRKGRILTTEDVEALRSLGRRTVHVFRPGADDVEENAAAQRIAAALLGPGLMMSTARVGRVNLLAEVPAIVRVDPARLARINAREGITVAVLRDRTAVAAHQLVATVKIVPFAVSEAAVQESEKAASEGSPPIAVDRLAAHRVGLVLSGSRSARARIVGDFDPPLRTRIEEWGSTIEAVEFVHLDDEDGETALVDVLRRLQSAGLTFIVLAGETAIVDRHDVAPRAIEAAGGEIVAYGAPVDPGNLLLLATLGTIPIVGVPGCARSRKGNVVDIVVPRLLAGERLGREDIAALGHGGLLEEVPERPVPREEP